MLSFAKAWIPFFFCRSGHLVVAPGQFLDFVGHLLPQEPQFDLPRITGRICRRWFGLKSLQLEGWMGGLGTSLRLSRNPGSLVWLLFWSWFRPLVSGLRVFWMPVLPMIPKADGDSTPLGQRPLGVLPVVYRLWASLRLGHLREWVEGWLPQSVFSLGNQW